MEYKRNTATEEKIDGETLFVGKVLTLERDSIRLPDGREAMREVIRHNGAVAVVPLCDDGSVIMVEQFRYPHLRQFLEIPAGKLDSKDEVPLEAAIRELREETGAVSNKITYLGRYYPSPAILSEVVHLYLAEELEFGDCDFDDDEFLVSTRRPLDELCDMILRQEIEDGKTQAALLKVKMLKDREK